MSNILVNTKQGVLKGGIGKTEEGGEYFEFLEIPYAKPPIGDLRFKSPQPPEPWNGERTATNATKIASQVDVMNNIMAGTEDCLYLNVFTPKLPSQNDKLLPVMVFIHGGGFAFGSGVIKEQNGPDYFMDKDVVIVFINYRLNVFGFLSLGIPEAAGNMGLKDQVMALKWIQENIGNFGGDKDNVTVFGISAGGASIEYLMLSQTAKGLFHKAIIHSASSLNPWAITYEPKLLAFELAKRLGFKGLKIDYRGIYNYICQYSTLEIQTAEVNFLKSRNNIRTDFNFVPCVEKDFGDDDAFLTDNPYNILKQGKMLKIPVIRGFCNAEGMMSKLLTPNGVIQLEESKKFLPYWPYKIDDSYEEKLKKAYLVKGKKFSIEFFSDFDFVAGIWAAGKLMADRMEVYMYEISYDGEVNFLKKVLGYNGDVTGSFHGDDTSYILKIPNLVPTTESDKLMKDRLVMMWTTFAKSGNPTAVNSDIIRIQWPRFTRQNLTYLNIDKKLILKSNYEPAKMEIFQKIYEQYKK